MPMPTTATNVVTSLRDAIRSTLHGSGADAPSTSFERAMSPLAAVAAKDLAPVAVESPVCVQVAEDGLEERRFDGVIFDLDGTLLDTTGDLAEACNWAIGQLGYPPVEFSQWRQWAGIGHYLLMKNGMQTEDEELILKGVALKHEFDNQKKYSKTRPFDGIPAILDAIQSRGMKLAILTNKPHEFVHSVVGTHFDVDMFDVMRGAGEEFPIKPSPLAAFHMAKRMGLDMHRILYIGDTHIDMKLGRAAGMYTVGVTWGTKDEQILREHGAHEIVHRPESILEIVDSLA